MKSGEICDALGTYTFPKASMKFFESFCRQLINQRKQSSEGRTSDFINLMLKSEISENEKSSATRTRFEKCIGPDPLVRSALILCHVHYFGNVEMNLEVEE